MLELARPDDWEAVHRLSLQVHDLHAQWRPDIFYRCDEPYPQEKFLEDIRDRTVYVAKIGGVVLGYVAVSVLHKGGPGVVEKKMLRLDSIVVEKTARGQGIGKQMVAETGALAKVFGCRELILGVHPENDGAVGFYQKCGFRIRTINMDMKL